jgi:hypothetical protein
VKEATLVSSERELQAYQAAMTDEEAILRDLPAIAADREANA